MEGEALCSDRLGKENSQSQFQYSAPEPSSHSLSSHGSKFQRILDAVSCSALSTQEEVRATQPEAEAAAEGAVVPTQLDHDPVEELPSATQVDSERMHGFAATGSQNAQQRQEGVQSSQDTGSASAWDVPDAFVKPPSQAESAFESPHAKHLSMRLSLKLGSSPSKPSQSPQSAKQTQSDDVTQLPANMTTLDEPGTQPGRDSNTVVQTQFDLRLTFEEQAHECAEPTQFSLHVPEDVHDARSHQAEKSDDDGSESSSGNDDDDGGVVHTQFDLYLDESEPAVASHHHAASLQDTPSDIHTADVGSSAVRLQFSADTEPATPTPADAAEPEAPSSGWKPRRSLDPPPAESPIESQHAQPREGRSMWASLVRYDLLLLEAAFSVAHALRAVSFE